MSTKKGGKQSRIMRGLKWSAGILSRVRDLYVKSMMGCADNAGYSTAVACSAPHFAALPRSFSVNSSFSMASEEDLRELIRVSSIRTVPRSRTVAIERIDEDKPCRDQFGVSSFPKSRSYAAGSTQGKKVLATGVGF